MNTFTGGDAGLARCSTELARCSTESVPSVVVVDPAFDTYTQLAASARSGKLSLHFRSSGSDALKLAKRHRVDAWLIAADLDDMSGFDFVELLRSQHGVGESCQGMTSPRFVAMVGDRTGGLTEWQALEAGADQTATKPITFRELERILGMSPEQRQGSLAREVAARTFMALPVGVGAAVVATAIVMLV